jgi:nucleoside-diphosphate-sugar epimerase
MASTQKDSGSTATTTGGPDVRRPHVIITGGGGFIGSHLCDAFLERGYAVTAIDNFVTGRRANLARALEHPEFELVEADVSRPLRPERLSLLGRHGLRGVLHFACPASPVDFDRIPFEILEVDSLGTIHTVELALRHGARYLLASTSEVYGDPLVHPQREDYWGNVNTIGPRACYDEAKRFAEAYVSTAIRLKGLDAGIARIFNTYGPRMRLDDGRVVPELCSRGLRGLALPVHGSGSQTRSFCYVSDLVAGLMALFESEARVPVNLGNPDERSVEEFARAVGEALGKLLPIERLPARPDDPRRRCPDTTRARELLGWAPRVGLEAGLALTLTEFRRELGLT